MYNEIIDLREDKKCKYYPLAAYVCDYFQLPTLSAYVSTNLYTYFIDNRSQIFNYVPKNSNTNIMANKFIPLRNKKVKVYSSNTSYLNKYYLNRL